MTVYNVMPSFDPNEYEDGFEDSYPGDVAYLDLYEDSYGRPAETLSVVDTVIYAKGIGRVVGSDAYGDNYGEYTPGDVVSVSDVCTQELSRPLPADLLSLTDPAPTTGHAAVRGANEQVGVTDTVSFHLTLQAFASIVGVTDLVETAHAAQRSHTDNLNVTDVSLHAFTAERAYVEPISVTDVSETDFDATLTATVSDVIEAQDDLDQIHNPSRPLADAIGVTDNLEYAFGREVTDTFNLTDIVAPLDLEAIDIVGVIDSLSYELIGRTSADPVGVTDSISVIQQFNYVQWETILLIDGIASGGDRVPSFIEVVSLSDSLSWTVFSTDPIVGSTTMTLVRTGTTTLALSGSKTFVTILTYNT